MKDLSDLDVRDQADSPRILTMLFEGKSQKEIAEALDLWQPAVSLKISRLMETGEFQAALVAEWVTRYSQMKVEDAAIAFKQLTKLAGLCITKRSMSTQEIDVRDSRVEVKADDAELKVLNQAADILNKVERGKKRSESLH